MYLMVEKIINLGMRALINGFLEKRKVCTEKKLMNFPKGPM